MNEPNLSDAALAELLTLTMEVTRSGTMIYRNHLGQLHRVHGPALIYWDGPLEWYQNDLIHRTDGPAVVYPNGSQYWYLNGQQVAPEDYHARLGTLLSSSNQ